MKYKILEHSADLKIHVFGKDLPEVFVNAALAVAGQQLGVEDSEKFSLSGYSFNESGSGHKEEVVVESPDIGALLVDWLNEILYQSEIHGKVYIDFKVTAFSESPPKIKAEISGAPVTTKKEDIKAATYHGIELKKNDGGWSATILLDI